MKVARRYYVKVNPRTLGKYIRRSCEKYRPGFGPAIAGLSTFMIVRRLPVNVPAGA